MRADHIQHYQSFRGELDSEGNKIFHSVGEFGNANGFMRLDYTDNSFKSFTKEEVPK